jgi:hypothetical protein
MAQPCEEKCFLCFSLKVKELISALGQTIGVSADSFDKLNVDQMVNVSSLIFVSNITSHLNDVDIGRHSRQGGPP